METSNLRNKLRKRLPAISEDLESKRSEARRSQMTADTLRSVAEMVQLDTTGSKTDLIERISTHCPNRRSQQEERSNSQTQTQIDEMRLDNSLTNMFQDDDQDFSDAMEEEIGAQSKRKKRKVNHRDPDSEKTSPSSSDMEIVRHKRARQTQIRDSEIRSLLTEIRELRKDMICVNTKVEKTRTKVKIEDEWPEEHFGRSKDQHEYNLLRSIGRDLDLGINSTSTDEAVTYIEAVRKKVKDRMLILKVAKKYGWDVAAELPQSAEEELTDYAEIIDKAWQVAATKQKQRSYDTSKKDSFFVSHLTTTMVRTQQKETTMNQQKNLIQTDTMIQGTIITQKDTTRKRRKG
ncbi:12586_t:CDS:1 [Cetraspora pellucida]|uniref:12586_t:CDS:1 n=1 Tax=Cetraspora pellucida TaxID=1433469 RepID=A0ACA9K171_9GLOM|nr:12586_t:CDS:1 [Cetraspora pellucida]